MNLLGKKVIICGVLALIFAAQPTGCFAGNTGIAARWKSDEGKKDAIIESIRGTRDRIEGNFRYGRQVRWQASK
ncbi:MAG: hypothetical protein JSW23_03980 [Planctomycetota bacterium]|nr:MAG: hypothetical protein JSW23_03980 [Planctomycetota bacterium]